MSWLSSWGNDALSRVGPWTGERTGPPATGVAVPGVRPRHAQPWLARPQSVPLRSVRRLRGQGGGRLRRQGVARLRRQRVGRLCGQDVGGFCRRNRDGGLSACLGVGRRARAACFGGSCGRQKDLGGGAGCSSDRREAARCRAAGFDAHDEGSPPPARPRLRGAAGATAETFRGRGSIDIPDHRIQRGLGRPRRGAGGARIGPGGRRRNRRGAFVHAIRP